MKPTDSYSAAVFSCPYSGRWCQLFFLRPNHFLPGKNPVQRYLPKIHSLLSRSKFSQMIPFHLVPGHHPAPISQPRVFMSDFLPNTSLTNFPLQGFLLQDLPLQDLPLLGLPLLGLPLLGLPLLSLPQMGLPLLSLPQMGLPLLVLLLFDFLLPYLLPNLSPLK